ncbi:hypothetical protein RhiirA5_439243 [Rhizophagus irregularis]|uniref:Uncharacterized protein n=1 Tax=Rhizophagus irregularis TaxID=588596 RepID=A0A2N0NI39_9GLOM|nr:hypothetical protein RhiirA5_439243 [Rhizophagus irregularis]
MEEPYYYQEVYKLYNSLNLDKINMNPANVDIIGGIVSYNSFSLNGVIVGNANLSVGIDCQCQVCKLDKSETPETAHKRA